MNPIRYKEAKKIIAKNGYTYDHTTGSHEIYKKQNSTLSVPKKSEISPGVWRNLLKLMAVIAIIISLSNHLPL